MDDINTAVDLFDKGDWSSFESFCASLTDDRWLTLFFARCGGYTVVGWMLMFNPPHTVWLTVKAAADRLGVLILSQTSDDNSIPLHWALQCCSVVAVVSSVIEGTPPTMLQHKNNGGNTPLDYLNSRDSSLANTVDIRALFQSALSVSVCVMLYAVPTCRQRRWSPPDIVAALFTHTTSPSTPPPNLTATHETKLTLSANLACVPPPRCPPLLAGCCWLVSVCVASPLTTSDPAIPPHPFL